MTELRWTEVAEADLAAIDDYLYSIDRALADEIAAGIEAAARFLLVTPGAGSP